MSLPSVAVDFNQSLDIETIDSAQVTLYLPVAVNLFPDTSNLVFGQILDPGGFVYLQPFADCFS